MPSVGERATRVKETVLQMANHKSAAKRARQSKKRQVRNAGVRTRVKRTVRAFHEAAESGDKKASGATFQEATKALRKAASKGVLHKRTVSRRVSRLSCAHDKVK